MRDLAGQNYSRARITIPRSLLRIALLLAVVLVVLFVVKLAVSSGGVGGSSIELRDAPKGLIPVSVSGVEISSEDAINLTIESATFQNVGDVGGSASASRKYGDGSYSLTVSANLPGPKGNPYQVWIVGDGEVVLAGKMNGSGNSWSLVFNDKDKNFSKMNEIWITREITEIDNKPEKHILEGTF